MIKQDRDSFSSPWPAGRKADLCWFDPSDGLPQLSSGDGIHIVECLVLAAHRPDKGIVGGSGPGMDAP